MSYDDWGNIHAITTPLESGGYKVIGMIDLRRRQTGRTFAACKELKQHILNGESVSLMDHDGPAYAERMADIFQREWNIQLVIKPIRETRQKRNLPGYISYGTPYEPLWFSIPEFETVTIGYSLRMFDIDKDWHPNESF